MGGPGSGQTSSRPPSLCARRRSCQRPRTTESWSWRYDGDDRPFATIGDEADLTDEQASDARNCRATCPTVSRPTASPTCQLANELRIPARGRTPFWRLPRIVEFTLMLWHHIPPKKTPRNAAEQYAAAPHRWRELPKCRVINEAVIYKQ